MARVSGETNGMVDFRSLSRLDESDSPFVSLTIGSVFVANRSVRFGSDSSGYGFKRFEWIFCQLSGESGLQIQNSLR